MNNSLQEKTVKIIEEIHSETFGFCELKDLNTMKHYKSWVQAKYHGEMQYLENHIPQKQDPQLLLSNVHSAISFQFPYYPKTEENKAPFKHLRTSLYAQLDDYHIWVKIQLNDICVNLKKHFPEEEFLAMTDSTPALEREIAEKAGLGWFGKNSCLIHPKKGSLFFLGEIFTTLKLKPIAPPIKDYCGQCNRCVEACPTDAILENRQIDARKCISYLNIELKTVPSLALRPQMKDWFFGCDICQTVCPWNEHSHSKKEMQDLSKDLTPVTADLIAELKFILQSSHTALQKKVSISALSRARGFGLKRNAIIISTNLKIKDLIPEIEKLSGQDRYKEITEWSLSLLSL